MADTTTTPNMNLVLPNVGECPGPAWATDNNAAFNGVDGHNHTPGNGVQINPAGLNINTDLTMAGNNLTNARSVRFMPQGSPLAGAADLGCIYESGVDLYYNDGAGNQVRITQGGNVTGSTGTITGLPSGTASASYAAGVFTWQAATNTPATMNSGPLVIGAAATVNSKTVTLTPTNTLAANYVLTFPAGLPGAISLATIDAAGNIATTTTPTLSGGVLNGTYSGNPTFSGNVTLSGGTLNGTYGGSPTFSGTVSIGGTALFSDGSSGSPSLAFTSATGTGFFHSGVGIGVSVTGAGNIARFVASGIYLTSGTAAAPSYSFGADTGTGVYSSGAGEIGFTTAGVQRGNVNNSGFRVISGTASNPSYSFLTDTNTGLYNSSDGGVNVATNGVNLAQFSPSGLAVGNITAASSIKWHVFTGSVANGGVSGSIPVPGSSQILGMVGNTATGNPIGYDSAAGIWFGSTALNSFEIHNASGSTRTYFALIYYQ